MTYLTDISNQLSSIYKEILPYSKKYLGYCHDLDYDGKKESCDVCGKEYIMDPSQIIILREIHSQKCSCGCGESNGVYICPNSKCSRNKLKENYEKFSKLINDYISSLKNIRVYRTNGDVEYDWNVSHLPLDPFYQFGYDCEQKCIIVCLRQKDKIQKDVPFNEFIKWQNM
jgi:hypothetical protein